MTKPLIEITPQDANYLYLIARWPELHKEYFKKLTKHAKDIANSIEKDYSVRKYWGHL
jgi:lipocalin